MATSPSRKSPNEHPSTQPATALLRAAQVSVSEGLSQKQVLKLQQQFGPNTITAHDGPNLLRIFLHQFENFIIYILLTAFVIAFLAGEIANAIVVLFVLLFNAILGTIQEYRAEQAMNALKQLTVPEAQVLRENFWRTIDAAELVPGDIIAVAEGARVPADARIIESANCAVLEASLTGESTSVEKSADVLPRLLPLAEQTNMLFASTMVVRGRATAIVTTTNNETEIGKIAALVNTTSQQTTPLQQKLERLGHVIGTIILVICSIIFLGAILQGQSLTLLWNGDFLGFLFAIKDSLLTAAALAVAAIPEGLPAIVTIALAIGVRHMVKRNAIIRNLPSVETLGETTVICTDKTGTLTKNELTVTTLQTLRSTIHCSGTGYQPVGTLKTIRGSIGSTEEKLLAVGCLCSDATVATINGKSAITGDPTEAALLVSAQKGGFAYETLRKEHPRIHELPFDSNRKLMSTVHQRLGNKNNFQCTKGSPEQLLACCSHVLDGDRVVPLNAHHKKNILLSVGHMASQALRVLGFAYKETTETQCNEDHLIFIGLQAMIDPPHDEVTAAIKKCADAGIRVIMITGDNELTGKAIAARVGITGTTMTGTAFFALSEREQRTALKTLGVLARVEPSHKMRIVELLQDDNQVVAMTGDGVNDAPALKKADIGIAMGISGTDVAKEASDMILRDDNFTSIVGAIEEGRGIYGNIMQSIKYLFSYNMAAMMIVLISMLLDWPLPMTAIMILWMNLVTDGFPALALSVDPYPQHLMRQPPRKVQQGILNNGLIASFCYVNILITIGVLSLFFFGMTAYGGQTDELGVAHAQTIAFTALISLQLIQLQSIRRQAHQSPFSNPWLIAAVVGTFILHLLLLYTPLSSIFGTVALTFTDWILIVATGAVVYLLERIGTDYIKKKLDLKD